MSSVWVIACAVELNGPGLLTDHCVLFQSGMLTFQITSPSTQWAPRRRTRTLTIGQKVRRDSKKETSNQAALLMNSERCLLYYTHARTHSGLCWITGWNWFSCYSCLAESDKLDCQKCEPPSGASSSCASDSWEENAQSISGVFDSGSTYKWWGKLCKSAKFKKPKTEFILTPSPYICYHVYFSPSFLLPPVTCRSKAVASPVEEWEG